MTLRPVNPDYRAPRLDTVDPLSFQDRQIPERRWIVPGWVPHSQTTMLTGDGGVGAGTEAGMYVSFDDGESWKPFQMNLPLVPITDLTIKNNNLIAATQGRSFWSSR